MAHRPVKPERFGPYRLLRLLDGGVTEVYEALNTTTQTRVAVKIVDEWVSRDPNIRKRTQHNARTLARVLDPHLVPIHDVGEIDGRLYGEAALIDGMDLRAILAWCAGCAGAPRRPSREHDACRPDLRDVRSVVADRGAELTREQNRTTSRWTLRQLSALDSSLG